MRNSHIKLPQEVTPKLAEFIGILSGDGYLYGKYGRYIIGIVGDPINDEEYYDYVVNLIYKLFNKKTEPQKIQRGLRIIFSSKKIFNYITKFVPYSEGGKADTIVIPEVIYRNWNLAKHTIRGLIDTDGSIFYTNKNRCSNYPTIEYTTSSYLLAKQVKKLLSDNDFRVTKIWNYKSKLSTKRTYKIGVNGRKYLKKWVNEIGFSNPIKLRKATKN